MEVNEAGEAEAALSCGESSKTLGREERRDYFQKMIIKHLLPCCQLCFAQCQRLWESKAMNPFKKKCT